MVPATAASDSDEVVLVVEPEQQAAKIALGLVHFVHGVLTDCQQILQVLVQRVVFKHRLAPAFIRSVQEVPYARAWHDCQAVDIR